MTTKNIIESSQQKNEDGFKEAFTQAISEKVSAAITEMKIDVASEILGKGIKHGQRFTIKDEHKAEYPQQFHGWCKATSQMYRVPGSPHAMVQLAPEHVGLPSMPIPVHHIGKMMREEAESIDELSKGTLKSYVSKSLTDIHNKAYRAGEAGFKNKETHTKNLVGSVMRQMGVDKAMKKLTKEESLNEAPMFHVWDNEGKTADRYTVAHKDDLRHPDHAGNSDMLGMSHNPTDPQGFSQFGSGKAGPHLGKKIPFETLPTHLQHHVKSRYGVGLSEETETLLEYTHAAHVSWNTGIDDPDIGPAGTRFGVIHQTRSTSDEDAEAKARESYGHMPGFQIHKIERINIPAAAHPSTADHDTVNESVILREYHNTESHPDLWKTHKLVHKSGKELKKGDKVKDFRGDTHRIVGFELPHHSGSSGRVFTKYGKGHDGYFFPDVVDAEIKKRKTVKESTAPGQEHFVKANKARFEKEYGKKKGLRVLYATAWKNKKSED